MDEQQINFLKPPPPQRGPASGRWQNYPLDPPPQSPKIKRWAFLIIGLAIFGLLIFRNYTMTKWPTNPSAYDPITLKPKKIGFLETVRNFIFSSDKVLAGQNEDRINILLLGIGGPGHEGPYLSDTNIILSIRPSVNQVAMISVPRDLAAKINGHGLKKINNANAFGEAEKSGNGGEYARKIFEETFNINIPYYARVDFSAFKELIDNVGEIIVNVERPFTDTSFPDNNDALRTVSFDAGPQQMNGERALTFARSRHGNNGEGSDFARTKRQQLVLASFKKKLLSAGTFLNPITLQKVISSLSKHINTNLDFGQIMFLINMAKTIDSREMKTLVLDDAPNGLLKPLIGQDGAYLLAPKNNSYAEINSAIQNIFNATNTPAVSAPDQNKAAPISMSIPTAKIEIQNGTWRVGLAAIKKQELEKDGLYVSAVGNSVKRPIATTIIYIINTNTPKNITTAVMAKLNASSTPHLPEWLQSAYNASGSSSDIIIIFGEDANTAK